MGRSGPLLALPFAPFAPSRPSVPDRFAPVPWCARSVSGSVSVLGPGCFEREGGHCNNALQYIVYLYGNPRSNVKGGTTVALLETNNHFQKILK